MTTRPSPSEHVAGWRDLLPENRTGWECDGSVSICYQRVDALREALARLEAAEKVIAEALSWMNTGDGRLTDYPLRRILSAYTKGTDRD